MASTDGAPGVPDARAVLALLANDDSRVMIARVTLGHPIADGDELSSRESRVLERLLSAGVIVPAGDTFEINTAGLRAAVASSSPARREGVDRFLHDGRIVDYPASDADRIALLEWIGRQVLTPGERIDERELNQRLRPFMDEHVLLRRYLVDYGIVERNPNGTGYALRGVN